MAGATLWKSAGNHCRTRFLKKVPRQVREIWRFWEKSHLHSNRSSRQNTSHFSSQHLPLTKKKKKGKRREKKHAWLCQSQLFLITKLKHTDRLRSSWKTRWPGGMLVTDLTEKLAVLMLRRLPNTLQFVWLGHTAYKVRRYLFTFQIYSYGNSPETLCLTGVTLIGVKYEPYKIRQTLRTQRRWEHHRRGKNWSFFFFSSLLSVARWK